ncbi:MULTISPECIES: polysaccharide biosynthesis protein [Exiguobacterium]|uniref:polysaccharide biosynthesis protein n=1 Tax=Exiguobacterium TaxID=33986 RepID=UPI001BECDB7A|nr:MULTISPECIES: nucleoside-diphosphate sugar epimerase/dehydratase [Exiguobacterium]MCT4777224.1 polysaccharide biosynthesis protein [Exiguobacterium aquaticum]MCT4789422.1 polysaccharide biosynthesis protein [Exiguobacterium mexicanum]
MATLVNVYRKNQRNLLFLCLDILIVSFVLYVTFELLFSTLTSYAALESNEMLTMVAIKIISFSLVGTVLKIHRIDWRYASVHEMKQVAIALLSSDLVLYAYNQFHFGAGLGMMIAVQGLLAFNLILFTRFLARNHVFDVFKPHSNHPGRKALIIGAGDSGQLIVRELKEHRTTVLCVVGLLDDDPHLQSLYVHGVPVLGMTDDLERIIQEHGIEVVILAIPSLSYARRLALLKRIEKTGAESHALPMISELATGKVSISEIREVKIEDLLGREPVQLDISGISSHVEGATILVTGAGGSIGSELCRQLIKFAPAEMILLGHGENSIYLIERELRELGMETVLHPVIGDVQDEARLEEVFRMYKPEIVYHAAAHKHVPLMEGNPLEAVKNNIYGTKHMVDVAARHKVNRFIMISTDKAVNPTNVMGSTKRIAEMVVQEKARASDTIFAVVRFGNVLGSRGSVVPLFKEQILRGGPVTVTDAEMTRYFMTIPEASRLVIQASVLARGGEVFVLDMGDPVKIIDLAKKMIELSGFTTDQIGIEVTGIRPGEKLYEELLAESELGPEANVFPKIFVGQTRPFKTVSSVLHLIETFRDDRDALMYLLLFIANSDDLDRDIERLFTHGVKRMRPHIAASRLADGN